MATDPVHWLLTEARRQPTIQAFVDALGPVLREAGIPVVRVWYGSFQLHPLQDGVAVSWIVDGTGTTWRAPQIVAHGQRSVVVSRAGPMSELSDRKPIVRHRLTGREPDGFDLPSDLTRLRCTEFVAMQLFADSTVTGTLTVATDEPEGFDATFERIAGLRLLLGTALYGLELASLARRLLHTYLGKDAGDRVLAGTIRRGEGETLEAALWISDLRSFTDLTERLPRDAVLRLLDDAFEAQVGAVEAHGGSVLKFMGDGLLAMFPTGEDACRRALAAARDALARLAAANRARAEQGEEPVRIGIGLHFGDVSFGNIGSRARLDFTVIGPAVNRAARLEGLTSRTGRPIVVSEAFALRCGEGLDDLGTFELKGLAEPVRAWSPR